MAAPADVIEVIGTSVLHSRLPKNPLTLWPCDSV
jgi:hypothetical protein